MNADGAADPQALAEAIAARVRPRETSSDLLGIEIVSVGPGRCTTRMRVRADMLNGGLIAHGGLVFSLADTAFGYACCSHGPQAVAQQASINWLRPALPGDTLTAAAVEVSRTRKSGVYDVTVTNQRGETVAVLRCLSRTLGFAAGTGTIDSGRAPKSGRPAPETGR
jgi:acyl-CoA thioesterase